MIKLVGVDRKSGNYQGNDYDNINLYVIDDCPAAPTICGSTAYKIKITRNKNTTANSRRKISFYS